MNLVFYLTKQNSDLQAKQWFASHFFPTFLHYTMTWTAVTAPSTTTRNIEGGGVCEAADVVMDGKINEIHKTKRKLLGIPNRFGSLCTLQYIIV